MSDYGWMELCEVSIFVLSELDEEQHSQLNAICVELQCPTSRRHPELTTLVLQAVPSSEQYVLPNNNKHSVHLHPLLYEFLKQAAEISVSDEEQTDDIMVPTGAVAVSIAPLPVQEYGSIDTAVFADVKPTWIVSRTLGIEHLPLASRICVTCVYFEDATGATATTIRSASLERQLSFALEGRLIRMNSLLALPTLSRIYLVTVSNITVDGIIVSREMVYRVGSNKDFDVNLIYMDAPRAQEIQSKWEHSCPGYEDILGELVALSLLTGVAAPAGILLTGCAGVGKTQLASCLAHKVVSWQGWHVQWVSAQDLLVRASWAAEADLLELIVTPVADDRYLLVLDDLQILASDQEEDASHYDSELLLVHNTILQALSRLSIAPSPPIILGITSTASRLPREFVRIGRFEKEIQMHPPTQVQREDILESTLNDVMDATKRRRWAKILASQTAGCVAADLRRLCADAWTKAWASECHDDTGVKITWHDLSEAARSCVPSQLAELDVTKTAVYPHDDKVSTAEPMQIHEWAWRNFGGYEDVKKHLFRTVVMPWRHFIASTSGRNNESETSQVGRSWVAPPSGVLFHGRSGVGKTFAASCLASSLGLHVVKVRASDVLDQWLGGSEAAIRSLFSRARAASPCILFFDEIDAIACNRDDNGSPADVSSRILTTLLNEMDGITSNAAGGVLVVGCTNRLDTLDAALLRPGRLDEHVLLPMPTRSDVYDILKLNLQKVPLSEDVNVDELAELLVELDATGADTDGVCRNACSRAIRDALNLSSGLCVSQRDLIDAIIDWKK